MPLHERARNMCNLLDNQSPRKKAALVEVLKEHPVKKLFQAAERCLDMESELGLESCDVEEEMEQGEVSEVVDETNPLHRKVQVIDHFIVISNHFLSKWVIIILLFFHTLYI